MERSLALLKKKRSNSSINQGTFGMKCGSQDFTTPLFAVFR